MDDVAFDALVFIHAAVQGAAAVAQRSRSGGFEPACRGQAGRQLCQGIVTHNTGRQVGNHLSTGAKVGQVDNLGFSITIEAP